MMIFMNLPRPKPEHQKKIAKSLTKKKLKIIQFARLKLIQFVYHRSMDDFDIIIVKYARIN